MDTYGVYKILGPLQLVIMAMLAMCYERLRNKDINTIAAHTHNCPSNGRIDTVSKFLKACWSNPT